MRVALLSNRADAQRLDSEGGCEGDDAVLPIGPDARRYAEQRGWPIILIRDVITDESFEQGRARAQKIIDETASRINEFYRRVDGFPAIPLGDYFLFDLFIIIGQLLLTRQVIETVAHTHPIRIFQNKSLSGKTILGIRPHPDDLIAQVSRGVGDCSRVLYESDASSAGVSFRKKIRNLMPGSIIDILYQLDWWREQSRQSSASGGRRKSILVLGGMFDWKPIVFSPAFTHKYVPTFKSLSSYPRRIQSRHHVTELSSLISETVFPGRAEAFDFSGLARRIHSAAEQLSAEYGSIERLVRRHDAVLASVFVTPFQHVLAHCAIERGKPVICYQHGEMNLYPEVFSGGFTEILNSTHYFAYGEGVVSKYTPFVGRSKLKEVVVVGSTLKKTTCRGGRLVLYATGKWFKTARPYGHYPDPDSRLYEAQRDIITFLEGYARRNPSVRVIIKANNTEMFNDIPFKTELEIDYTSKFPDLLMDARLVILDTPATTCVEAASTEIPLFVLSGRSRWYDEPMRLLTKRAVVEGDVGRLLDRIARYEMDGAYTADLTSREFSDSYGGNSDAAKTAEIVIGHLNRIVGAGCAHEYGR